MAYGVPDWVGDRMNSGARRDSVLALAALALLVLTAGCGPDAPIYVYNEGTVSRRVQIEGRGDVIALEVAPRSGGLALRGDDVGLTLHVFTADCRETGQTGMAARRDVIFVLDSDGVPAQLGGDDPERIRAQVEGRSLAATTACGE